MATYNSIINKIKTFIINNCVNVGDKYDNNLPTAVKPGFKTTKSYDSYQNDAKAKNYVIYILTPIQKITSDNISNDITYYVNNNLNITNLNANISSLIELIIFYNHMINFCCNVLQYKVYKNPDDKKEYKYLIYTNNKNFQAININKCYENTIIKDSDVNEILFTMLCNINNNIKVQSIKYNYLL